MAANDIFNAATNADDNDDTSNYDTKNDVNPKPVEFLFFFLEKVKWFNV